MNIFEFIVVILLSSIFGSICGLIVYSISKQQVPTYKDMMDWDFRSCEQMREAGWSEEEIAELMRRQGNYYDKDYK